MDHEWDGDDESGVTQSVCVSGGDDEWDVDDE